MSLANIRIAELPRVSNPTTVDVKNLSYTADTKFNVALFNGLKSILPKGLYRMVDYYRHAEKSSFIESISFRASPKQLTGIITENAGERRTIVELIAGRRGYGMFDGDVNFYSDQEISTLTQAVAFVPRAAVKLYTPGLTYLEMITFAAKLRMKLTGNYSSITETRKVYLDNEAAVQERVMQVLNLMGLVWCKDRIITERPTTRGTLGGELRKLSIAVEIVTLPPIVLLDDITRGLDGVVAGQIMGSLKLLAENGHTVICAMPKPHTQVYTQLDTLVFVKNGRSIYAADKESAIKYFTSSPLNYRFTPDMDPIDFMLDIANGVERPTGTRIPPDIETLQKYFEDSVLNPLPIDDKVCFKVLPDQDIPMLGYCSIQRDEWAKLFDSSLVVIHRAFFVKFKEFEILKKSFMSSVIIGLFLGYFLLGQGDFGDYCLSLVGIPYTEVTNISACMFLMLAVLFANQVINVHILCQKIQIFRYEREAKCCPTVGFFLATFLSEIPFTWFFGFIFSNITYFMADLNEGAYNYRFYMAVHFLISIIGFTTALMFASVFRREIVVRDLFLFCLFMMFMTAGFIFPQPTMTRNAVEISAINCFRWAYEALMVWKYAGYPDGKQLLSTYDFDDFDKSKVFGILVNFIIFDLVVFFISLIPIPNTLHRKALPPHKANSNIDDARASSEVDISKDKNVLVKPDIYLRESSVSGKSNNSLMSVTGLEEEVSLKGPSVHFRNLSYQVADRKSPMGYKNVLHMMNGRFDSGRLSAIMGAHQSGKSSLLSILAGEYIGTKSLITGQVLYDSKPINSDSLKPWQRCAFIEALDEHFRDLSVKEILIFAMQLRSNEILSDTTVEINVQKTMDLLKLNEVADVHAKKLDPGSYRRLTIAEEVVHGPSLIYVDEPITELEGKDVSTIMTGAFREFVNQDRTVIITVYQPTQQIFELLDTVCLLSKGRLIYMGPAPTAVEFFVQAPSLSFEFNYKNPADFLSDISDSQLMNSKGVYVDSPTLENFYKSTLLYTKYETEVTELYSGNAMQVSGNPMMKQGGDKATHRLSLEMGSEGKENLGINERLASETKPFNFLLSSLVHTISAFHHFDLKLQVFKAKLLLLRSWKKLFQRKKLVLGSTAVIFFLAFLFGGLLGESTNESGTVTGMFGIGFMLVFLSNIQFAFWLFTNNQIFLREHSRGLYSAVLQWAVDDLPLLFLRTVQCGMFAVPVHEILKLNPGEEGGFYFLATWISFIMGTILVMSFVYTLPNIRSAYSTVPAVAFLLFFFSGIVIKPSTLPRWLAPWLPSVSMVRWLTQALCINEYKDNREAFPVIEALNYSSYESYLNLFGWGGKTKWFCLNVLILMLFLYKGFNLYITLYTVFSQRGKRGLRKASYDERLY